MNEKWIGFEGFVAQAIALSSDVENYHPHKCGSSYEVLSMMSFENIHKTVFTKEIVAQAIALSSDVEVYHPHKCGSSYEVLSMMSFENIHKIYYMKSSYRFLLFDNL